ncbi:MAG: hypothetical protein ACRD68_13410, partial [Pyrinomonadaceae bacterium]
MNNQTYNDQVLTQYILGSLSGEEAERLDELSFTDDELAGRLRVLENDLVDAYARGELSGRTKEMFDSRCLSSPEWRDKVRFAEVFVVAADRPPAAAHSANGRLASAANLSAEKPASRGGWRRRFFFPMPALGWGLAVAVLALLVTAGGWLAVKNSRLRQQAELPRAEGDVGERREQEARDQSARQRAATGSEEAEREKEIERQPDQATGLGEQQQGQLQPSPEPTRAQSPRPPAREAPRVFAFALAAPRRGAAQPPAVNIPADADRVTARLALESDDYPSYQVVLKAPSDNRAVWSSGRLRARRGGDGKVLVVTLRPGLLKSQTYLLEVSGVAAGGAAEPVGSY